MVRMTFSFLVQITFWIFCRLIRVSLNRTNKERLNSPPLVKLNMFERETLWCFEKFWVFSKNFFLQRGGFQFLAEFFLSHTAEKKRKEAPQWTIKLRFSNNSGIGNRSTTIFVGKFLSRNAKTSMGDPFVK